MDRFIINARPQPFDAYPHYISIYPAIPTETTKFLTIIGRSFYNIRNVYFKGVKHDIFNTPVTLYNPFSSVAKLSANNTKFYGIKIENFIVVDNNKILIEIPQIFSNEGFIDVVIENEAGFGFLTEESKVSGSIKFGSVKDTQKYTVNGIYVNII
jgi:hypothetical protein